jgi:Glycogen recognition site of AMP-activated protein kinase
MGNYASKDGEAADTGHAHDSIPSRSAPPQRQYRSDEPSGHRGPSDEQALALEGDMDNTVPTVFKWEHGGRNVYITGTFNNWERQIPMHRSGNDFSYVHNLKRGKHAFKFIVDDEWRFAPDQPTVADIEGRINNFIDVSDFAPYSTLCAVWLVAFVSSLTRRSVPSLPFFPPVTGTWRSRRRQFLPEKQRYRATCFPLLYFRPLFFLTPTLSR